MISRRRFLVETSGMGACALAAADMTATNNGMSRPVLEDSTIFKKIEVTPSEIEAGGNAEFRIKITVGGGYPLHPTRLAISLPTQLGFAKPSLFIDEDYGYLEVYSNNPAVSWTKRLWDVQNDRMVDRDSDHPRRWGQHLVLIDLSAGLKENDFVQLNWGDLGRGFGKGTPAAVLCPKSEYYQYIWVRYYSDQNKGVPDMERDITGFHQRPVPDAEAKRPLRIHPKPLHRWRAISRPKETLLVPLDLYGNVTPVAEIENEIEATEKYRTVRNGVYHYSHAGTTIRSRRVPISRSAGVSNVFDGRNIYFGDVHTHSKYSNDVIEEGRSEMSPHDLHVFARERAGLDFYAITEHHQPQDSPRDQIMEQVWNEIIEATIANDKPGEFLIFPGFEYRCARGDTVLFFNYLPTFQEIHRPEWTDIRRVWDALKGKDYISLPHFHNPGKLSADEWWSCPYEGVEPVAEIFSCHRSFERFDVFEQGRALVKHNRPDRNGAWFLRQGFRYGFVADSDSHYGHPGMQGLSAVYARALDKTSIMEAYRGRHVYGVSGDRIRLLFTGNGKLMGSVLENTGQKEITIDVVAENRLKKIELFRNGELFRRFLPEDPIVFRKDVRIDDPEPSNWYVRVTQENNQMAWSSAIWYSQLV